MSGLRGTSFKERAMGMELVQDGMPGMQPSSAIDSLANMLAAPVRALDQSMPAPRHGVSGLVLQH